MLGEPTMVTVGVDVNEDVKAGSHKGSKLHKMAVVK